MSPRFRIASIFAFACLFSFPLLADEVIFNNGDKLTGKITSMDSGKLKIHSDIAGDISVDMKNVKTFSSTDAIDIHLKDGSVIHQKVAASDKTGNVALAPGGTLQPQTVELANVKKINEEGVRWTGSIAVGGLITRGNSDTDNLSIALDLIRRTDFDRITIDANYLYGRQKDKTTGAKSTTTDNWTLAGKYDYFLNEGKLYLYGNAEIDKDRIAFLNLRFAPGGGVGYQWVESDKMNFNTEGGVGWFYEDFSDDGIKEHATARLAYHFDYKLNDKVQFINNVAYYPGLDSLSDYYLTADAGVRANLTKNMFTEFKVIYQHQNRPAPGALKDDMRYMLNVGWTIQ